MVVEKEVQVEAQAEGVVRQVKEKNLKIHGVFTWAEYLSFILPTPP